MQNPNPNPNPNPNHNSLPKDSTSNAKSSGEEESSLKTALEVLVEFSADRGGREDWRVDENGDRVSEGQALKKRKNNEVKENPSENPICPKCKREFPTWETTIAHMLEHPNSTSIASSSTLLFDLNKVDNDVQPMEIEETSNVALEPAEEKVHEGQHLRFDLNQLPPKEEDDVM